MISWITSFFRKRKLVYTQREFLRNMVIEDSRWLAENEIAKELLHRYERAISTDWHKIQHERISDFRERVIRKNK